jgi:mono/diheme cytochrome c family protein
MTPGTRLRPLTLARGAALLLLLSAAVAGCDSSGPIDDFTYPTTIPYPSRTDSILVNRPTIAPTHYDPPGSFPLQVLDLPPAGLSGDGLALREEVTQKKAALDPRKLGNAERGQLIEALTKRFGTPGAPKVAGFGLVKLDPPETADEATFVKDLRLEPETLARGSVLFRQNCLKCHGLTGDGRGPAGASAVPHPRDYRQGVFKYTRVALPDGKRRPARDDLKRLLLRGVPGTWMPSFAYLPERDLDALVSYVIHLSLRGEVETAVLAAALKDELDSTIENEVKGAVERLGGYWYESQRHPLQPDPDPYDTPEKQSAAAAKGQRVFVDGQQGGCAACHINLGRSAPFNYDVWGTIVRPRNLVEGQFRGGGTPEDVYARLFCGIGSSGMPAFETLRPSPAEKERGEDRLWQLVHFVRAVATPHGREELRTKYQIELD